MAEGAETGQQQTVMAESSTEGFDVWLESMRQQYQKLSDNEKNATLDHLIDISGAPQLHYLSAKVDALFYRDFLKFFPPELREYLLTFFDLKTLLNSCCVCRTWNQIVCSSTSVWYRACRNYGLVVDREVTNGGHYWKSYLLSMNRRRQHMKTYTCFTSKVYEKYLRRVTAVHYFKGKVAAATESKNICVWDCNTDQCILVLRTDASVCSLKFDEHYIIASTYIGHLISWDVECGAKLMEYVRHAGAVFTFDYSSHLDLIVSGSSDFTIKIWSLSDSLLYSTIHDHQLWILKIVLKPHPGGEDSIYQERHILFTMDKSKIVVRFMSFVSNEEQVPRGMYLTTAHVIPVNNCDLNYFTPGLHFDATESKNICVWDCNTDQCILVLRTDASVCSLKFDEHYIIASTYIGHLISWDVECGAKLMEYVRHAGAVFTFDYSSHLDLIVSGSSDFTIKIWSLSDSLLYSTIHDHQLWILKIVLKPHPGGEDSIYQERHILFTMDKSKIVVRFMSFVSNEEQVPRGMYLTTAHVIPVNNCDLNYFTPGLHFDGSHLYFFCQHQNPGQVSSLYKWNVQQKRMESETPINQNVKVFLGVGEKYLAMVTPWRSSNSPMFVVIDKQTLEEVALWPLPPSRATSPDCCQIALGECDWLNGLDGRNDQGVLLAAGLDDNTVYVVKWVPRNVEDNT